MPADEQTPEAEMSEEEQAELAKGLEHAVAESLLI